MIVTREKFAIIGEALYGARWKTALALALDLDVRMIHEYAAGTTNVPRATRKRLATLCHTRGAALVRISAELDPEVTANFRNS